MTDPSLSVNIRAWRDVHCRLDGAAHVFLDGVDFENMRHAIGAAWLAADYYCALNLACRYGVEVIMCLRCTQRDNIMATTLNFTRPSNCPVPAAAWRALCSHCCLDLMGIL